MIAMLWAWLWSAPVPSPEPNTGGSAPPVTNYLLDGSGNILTDASGNRLLNG